MSLFKSKKKFVIKQAALALLSLFVFCPSLNAQNVTISPKTGNFVAAVSYGNEGGFALGFSSMWRHNQLPLSFTTSDGTTLTSSGLLKLHANNIIEEDDNMAIIATGDAYFTLSMPRGYRFTGYKFVFVDKYAGYSSSNEKFHDWELDRSTIDWSFSEMDKTFTKGYGSGTTFTIAKGTEPDNKEYTVSRTATNMDNILYFHLSGGKTGNPCALYVKSIEITFECDKDFTASVAPATYSTSNTGVSVAGASFNTGKTDIGVMNSKKRTSDGVTNTFLGYDYLGVTDLKANNYLYEHDAVTDGKMDATQGTKTIYSVVSGTNNDKYFGLKNNTYYVETPVEATAQGNVMLPLGYRITGAKINYAYGDANYQTYENVTKSGFYIKYSTSDDYYLDTTGKFVKGTDATATMWTMDAKGRISSGGKYLYEYTDEGYYRLGVTSTKSKATKWYIDSSNSIYCQTETYSYPYYTNHYIKGNSDGTAPYFSSTADGATKRGYYTYTEVTGTSNLSAAKPYTITFFDKQGNQLEAKTVNSAADNGSYELTDFNNDAVKFSISGDNDPMALVTVDLTMEPLNPYINNVDIVAKQTGLDTQPISQQFLADDFTIGDGVSFNVPTSFDANGLTFTFDDLRNKHADTTYGPLSGDGNSRYNFVNSVYYNQVNEDLYTNASTVADHDYLDKVAVAKAGNQAYVFNNAADLVHSSQTTVNAYYTENPFSLSKYTAAGGSFTDINMAQGETSKECYLFTADETRYNIAPTTKTMHMYYAYYKTLINLAAKDYTPSFTYTPIYNSTLHGTSSVADTKPFVGVKLGVEGTEKGFLTVNQINDKIAADITAKTGNAPADLAHVLYIDASPLRSVISSTTYGTLDALKTNLATNALVYLPLKAIYTADNYAYQTISGGFKAGNNIILTDKEPFFAPYDIQVDATHYADYKRLVTVGKYGQVKYGTILLPFTLKDLQNGVHTDVYGTVELLQMNATNATKVENDNYGTGYFTPIADAETSANTPYALHVKDNKLTDDNASFALRQYGSNIVATPASHITNTVYTPSPEITSTGSVSGSPYTFSHKGTFSGDVANRGDMILYFAKNGFYSAEDLDANHTTLKILPFRSFYTYSGTGAKGLSFGIEIGENPDPTGINNVDNGNRESIVAGEGTITVTANGNETFRINSITGQGINFFNLNSGDSRTVRVPSGMYIVNGVKVIVK
jgi:hypothetical protein